MIDKCIECGFCESVCPSRNLTVTPRQRITLWREIQRRRYYGLPDNNLVDDFQYLGLDTCAADGMCANRCPVDIDTGEFIKKLRSQQRSKLSNTLAEWSGDHFSLLGHFTKITLGMASLRRKIIGTHRVNDYPSAVRSHPELKTGNHRENVVYFSSCIHRLMAPDSGNDQYRVIFSLLDKAGFNTILPPIQNQLCCGLPYDSKGYKKVSASKISELQNVLLTASKGGSFPVICDNSPCSYQLIQKIADCGLKIYDAPSFFAKYLERFSITPKDEKILIYSVCSQQKAKESESLLHIARACSTEVKVIEQIACCGFGGDRGFSHPELNASALDTLEKQAEGSSSGYSSSRTCEIGLSKYSGLSFNSILQLLDEQT